MGEGLGNTFKGVKSYIIIAAPYDEAVKNEYW